MLSNWPGQRYRSLSGSLVDHEKRRYSDASDDDTPSLYSSDQPMLSNSSPPRKNYALSYHLPRRRFSRYFTLIIASILVLMVVYLVKMGSSSDAQIRMGLRKGPDPPNPWESFPFLKRYHGGIRSLVKRKDNVAEYPTGDEADMQAVMEAAMAQKKKDDKVDPKKDPGFQKRDTQEDGSVKAEAKQDWPGLRFDPYKQYSWGAEYEQPVHCYLDNVTKREIPPLLVHEGIPEGFPDPVMGSYDLFGLNNDVCFERYGRLGPYGFGYSRKYGGSGAGMEGEKDGSESVWGGRDEIDYRDVKWAKVQQSCMEANAHRFKQPSKEMNHFFRPMGTGGPVGDPNNVKQKLEDQTTGPNGKKLVPRTAIIIRTWKDYQYDDEDMFYLRALMNELTIQSGTEYVVHFLIQVKDLDLQIWADEETHERALKEALPQEFWGMGTLWSERQMNLVYGGVQETVYRDLPVFGVYRSTYLPLQYFAHMHPEYDFFWHWEMDIRYTGHFHHLFDKVTKWAKQQPRKGLWERNGRFYVPAEHGPWEDFRQLVRVQTEHGTARKDSMFGKLSEDAGSRHPLDSESRQPAKSIWGPERPSGKGDEVSEPHKDPEPPTTYEKDNYEWGVGEEADFITFNPLFDPHNTNWLLSEDVTGYNTSKGFPPRRTAIITASRLSKRLLDTMHKETLFKRHTMFSEMWPGSLSLHHGYKAVYAPHPVYIDRRWPTSYLAAIFNNGVHGSAGGSRTSVFSDERQHNFLGTTWYYHAGFSPNLWKRWLGYKVDNDGGEEWEMREGGEGRMCLPGMLLHPVKQVDLVYERKAGDG
ncbi:uncharacterized protein LTR77_010402 [Saxophila tyrrhenica]|uniref:Major facilitator superfamily transporter n=1 Tax=Saxophila tyrrhenica TaxID=1690608 RepID=A0AAV9NYZ2_9PEZI|nr:hypothetical protein LTR77_010402 [Saxophila tyrrhenica]